MTSQDMKSRQIELFDLLSRQVDGGDVALKCQLANRYLDPFPEDVEGSFQSILSSLEQLGQDEKSLVLDVLWKRGLSGAQGSVYDQVDYGHRVLLFLVCLSGRYTQETRVDGDCQRVVKEYCGRYSVEDRIRLEDERTLRDLYREDAETEEGQWWRQNMVYSSGDELSDWSSTLYSSDDDNDDSNGAVMIQQQQQQENAASAVHQVVDQFQDERKDYVEARSKPLIRDDTWKLIGTEAMVKGESRRRARLYRPTSLSVWLASKRCTSHLSDALNPRYCVSETVFVSQMIHCIQGCISPGFLCSIEEGEGYVLKSGVHLEHISMDALKSVAHQALGLANDLKRVERHIEFVKQGIDPIGDSHSVVLSHVHACERQVQICREYCKREAHGRSLIALIHATATTRTSSQLMDHVCQMMQSGSNEDIRDVLDEMQLLVESLHLECSSGWAGVMLTFMLEILLSMLVPFGHAMDALNQYGSSNNLLPRECRPLVHDRSVTPCPWMIEKAWDDTVSISRTISRLIGGSPIDDVGSVTSMILEVFRDYMDSIEVGQVEHQDEHLAGGESTDDDATPNWWNQAWMSEINEKDATLSQEYITRVVLPSDIDPYVMPPPQHTSAFDTFASVNNGIGPRFGSLMVESSQDIICSFRKISKRLSNYSSFDHGAAENTSIIDTIASRVAEKIQDIFIPSPASSSNHSLDHKWPIPPTASVKDRLSTMVLGHSLSLGKGALEDGIIKQIGAAKSLVLLDDFLWGRLVSGLLESCSSRSGLDSIAISNANTALCDILDTDTVELRRHIHSVWIECCGSEGIEASFASRTTSYLKLLQWHVTFRPPLDAMIEKESIDTMSDVRGLVLQLQWVWKTLSSTKKICLKLGGDTVTKQIHIRLLSMLTLLRQIMNYVYSTFDQVFDQVVQRLQGTQNIVHMKQCIHTGLTWQGSLCPTMPLRSHLETWLDACLHYGILVSRSILQSYENMQSPATVSPSTRSFIGGISSAEADVIAAQSSLIPIFDQVYHAVRRA